MAAGIRVTDRRALLSSVLDASGLSQVQLARAMAADPRSLRRWLAGSHDVPDTVADWLDRVVRIDATSERLTVVLTR